MPTPRWPWAGRSSDPALDEPSQAQPSPNRAEESAPASGAGTDAELRRGIAVLVGFPRDLEEALSVALKPGYMVKRVSSADKALIYIQRKHADLIIASNRCSTASILTITRRLGQPRKTRVIVLLAGTDPEAESRYRAAGLKHVLHMPVPLKRLLDAAG